MKRRSLIGKLGLIGLSVSWPRSISAQSTPDGVPEFAERAVVTGHSSGDTFTALIEDVEEREIRFVSAVAPSEGACFFAESRDRLESLIPADSVVYLERANTSSDGDDPIARHVWKPRDGRKAQFIDERMIADGFVEFEPVDDMGLWNERLQRAADLARSEERGMWAAGVCAVASVLPYEIVSAEDASFGTRERRSVRIVVQYTETDSDESVVLTVVDALKKTLQKTGADAVIVFAFRPDTDVESVFSLARGFASRDKRGWASDGLTIFQEGDNGNAVVEVVDWDEEWNLPGNNRLYEADMG